MKISPYESHRGRPKGLLKKEFLRKGGDMRKVTIIVLAIAFLAGSVSVFAEDRPDYKYLGSTGSPPTCETAPEFRGTDIGPQEIWAPNNKPVTVTISGTVVSRYPCRTSGAGYRLQDGNGETVANGAFDVNPDGSFTVAIQIDADRSGKEKEGKSYTIMLHARNNLSMIGRSAPFFVNVAHDQRKK
jgi:hypothetical protein